MYTSIGEKEPQKEKNCCYITACWIFQVLSWITLIPVIVYYFTNKNMVLKVLPSFGVFYLIYIMLEFCSKTGKYLCNKNSGQGIYQKMGIYFQTPPIINFHCDCYHYENRTNIRTDNEGNKKTEKRTEKVITYKETYSLPYYSARDVSGLFLLNCDKAYLEKKYYIKLKLKEEINFADAISYYDYKKQKSDFFRRNRFRDVHFDFTESRKIPGMKRYILVKLHAKGNCMINYFWFFIFTILTFAEFYRLYIDSCCVYQKFKVRKLVSTRYDLNQSVYQTLVPKIDLISQQYQYEQNYYNYKNDNYDLKLPTQEELEEAKQYQNKIPDYQISNGDIEDNPGYEYNPKEAPSEFVDIKNKVTLGKEHISDSDNIFSSSERLINSYEANSGRETGNNPSEV